MKHWTEMLTCPCCDNPVDVYDKYFCGDEDIRVSCTECNFIKWFKDMEDVRAFFIVCENIPLSKNSGRSVAWRRHKNFTKAMRKRAIARKVYPSFNGEHEYYSNLHQYSKNKIHCSCPICSAKTRNKGRRNRGNYSPSINYKISELKRQIAMNESEMEYMTNEE